MRSRAQFKGHPLHPALIAFPVAFLYGCFVADGVGRGFDWPRWWVAGAYASVAAVVSGLIAGVPGFVDYLYVVPPESTAKKRATWHMAVNLTALGLVAVGWAFRDWDTLRPGWMTVVLELGGAGLVTWGGWMGGTLVYRNQIGVDHRYANAGKWREATVQGGAGESVSVERAEEMKVGQMMLVRWNGRRLVVARTEEGFAVFDDHCTHRGGSLAGGVLVCGTVQCPWHGSQFEVCHGSVKSGPAEKGIGAYRAELRDGKVFVVLPEARGAGA